MLAHKVDGKHPTIYFDLLLAAQKLQRWAEARDPLLPKTTTTGGPNVTWPQTSGNLFPSRKLKGNHTFMSGSAIVKSIGTEGDSSVKPEGEEEAESSDGEDPETLSGIDGADQLIGYIIHFANAVKLYQRKNWNYFRCVSPDHLVKDCPKDLSKTNRKVSLNVKEGMMKKGGWTPQKPVVTHGIHAKSPGVTWTRLPEPEDIPKSSFLEPQSTYLVEWAWEHSLGQDWWWEQLGSFG